MPTVKTSWNRFIAPLQATWRHSFWSSKVPFPTNTIKAEGYWASFGTDQKTGQPILTCDWIDRLAPRRGLSWLLEPAPLTAVFMPWRAIRRDAWGSPIIWAGNGDRAPEIPIVCVPGCPVQPDNFMETLLYLLHMATGRSAHDPSGRMLFALPGYLVKRSMKGVTGAATTNRPNSPKGTAIFNAS